MDKNVVVLSFAEASKAYQALSELKAAAGQGRVELDTAAVVARGAEGKIEVKDGASDGSATTGSLTAPCWANVSSRTPIICALASLL